MYDFDEWSKQHSSIHERFAKKLLEWTRKYKWEKWTNESNFHSFFVKRKRKTRMKCATPCFRPRRIEKNRENVENSTFSFLTVWSDRKGHDLIYFLFKWKQRKKELTQSGKYIVTIILFWFYFYLPTLRPAQNLIAMNWIWSTIASKIR